MRHFLRNLLSLALFAGLAPCSAVADGESLLSLFDSSVLRQGALEEFLASHFVKWFQVVTIDANRLREEARNTSQLADIEDGEPILLDLFEDLSHLVHPTLVSEERSGWTAGLVSWSGKIKSESDFFASVTLHMNANDEVEGYIRTSIGRIRIEPTAELPYHIVWLQDFEAEQRGRKNLP